MKSATGGCFVVIVIFLIFLSGAGTKWSIGSLGMPEPIIDANGRYPNGSMVDPINRSLVASGYYQQAAWALTLLVAAVFLRLAILIRQTNRLKRRYIEVLQRGRRAA